jgi:surface polysaccharide O-acyltransferase-like enzyme
VKYQDINMTMKKERIWYWDILRITSMIFLVVRHCATATFEFVEVLSTNWWVCNVYGSLSAWMVPVFMMISGCSFLDPNRNVMVKQLYKRNIGRMILVFFFWAAFYAAYNMLSGQGENASFATMLFTGQFHLWFLPMIIGVYMLTPLLRLVTVDKRMTAYLAVVTFCVGVFIPTLQDLGLFFDNSLFTGYSNFGFASAYVAFFLGGYLLHNVELDRGWRMFIYTLGAIATVVVFLGTYYLTLKDGYHNEDMQGDNNLFPAIQGIAIFVFAKQHFFNCTFSENIQKLILEISKLTFGVYMIHVVLLALLDKAGFSPVNYPAIYMIPLLILFVLPASFFLSWAFKHIPVLGKYVV